MLIIAKDARIGVRAGLSARLAADREQYLKAVRILEGSGVSSPVRVLWHNFAALAASRRSIKLCLCLEVQDQQRFWMGRWGVQAAAGGQLKLCVGAGYFEEDAVIAIVINEPAGLGEPNVIAIEGDHFLEAVCMACDSQTHIKEHDG